MRMRDEVIWDEFIKNNPDSFSQVWYNVPLGEPFKDPRLRREAKNNGAWEATQWRIDVLAESDFAYYVIEIKPNAMGGALGQALAYKALLEKHYVLEKPVLPIVLTDVVGEITDEAARLLGVQVIIP